MGVTLYCLALLAVIAWSVFYFVPKYDRAFALCILLCLLPVHLFVLYSANQAIPFIPSEVDAKVYARESQRPLNDLMDALDISATATAVRGVSGGVGYIQVLTIVHQFVGDSLFFKKALNIAALWVLAFSWYAVALFLGGRALARWTAIACASLPSLWYFYCVLLRDLLIAASHSVLLASALLFCLGTKRKPLHLCVMLGAMVAGAILRPATVYFNTAILFAVFFAAGSDQWLGRRAAWKVSALVAAVLGMEVLLGGVSVRDALNFERKTSVDVLEAQAEGATAQAGSSYRSASGLLQRGVRGVPLFFASEPTIISKYLDISDPEQLRGLMNSAWFLFGVPFAAVGVAMAVQSLLKRRRARPSAKGPRPARPISFRAEKAGGGSDAVLLIVLLYCGVWFVVVTLAWDWTRWRLPVVPALCLIAVWAYRRSSISARCVSLAAWGVVLCVWRAVAGYQM